MLKPNIIKTSENPLQTIEVDVYDEYGEKLTKQIACERPLTVMLNWKEVVTLMTLGSRPEALVLGYLKNQSFLSDPAAIESVIIDWETHSAAVITKENTEHLEGALKKKTVTSGCGQGTMYGNVMKQLENYQVPQVPLKQSEIYSALEALTHYNDTYKKRARCMAVRFAKAMRYCHLWKMSAVTTQWILLQVRCGSKKRQVKIKFSTQQVALHQRW